MDYGLNHSFRFLRGMFDIFVYWGVPRRKPAPASQSPGLTQKSAPGEQKTQSNDANERSGERPDVNPDENPDDAPPHEPSAQPHPHLHAACANDAPNQP